LGNVALVFDNKKEKEYKEKALIHEQETDRLYKTIGQLTTQVDWLKTRRYITEMGIDAIYPKPNLSKRNQEHKIYPYLLRNIMINRVNQVWAIDITYIKLRRGFIYLTAIIDWHTLCIIGWELDDTLETAMVKRALSKALAVSKPEIINSDYTEEYTMPKNSSIFDCC
jgi:putative transposase